LLLWAIPVLCAAIFVGVLCDARKAPNISCINGEKVTFALSLDAHDVLTIPLIHSTRCQEIPFIEMPSKERNWKFTALYTESIGELVADLQNFHQGTPLLCLVQDANKNEYIVTIDQEGKSSVSSLPFLLKKNRCKKNFLEIEIPFFEEENPSPYFLIKHFSRSPLSNQ